MQQGNVVTDFVSESEEARFLAQKQEQGLTDVVLAQRYKIGTSELFEFTGNFQGMSAKGAGNTEDEAGFTADDPCFNLPAIYFLLGRQVIQSIQ